MRSRSHHHRLQSTADDWVDESWTVDCVCGVNFDDGEEMVNCDECGVWVHTRCSRYVKGDDVFVCHKCKTKNNHPITTTTTSNEAQEETEVAQFLVELPTKTVIMDTSLAANANVAACNNDHNPSSRRPFRLWTDIPIEERVHVQGIPGGDPSLFHGLSTVFTQQLWKSAGYIPKLFNFQYREFPCWDAKEVNEKHVDNSEAGAFFYLSKETVLPAPTTTLGLEDAQVGFDSGASSKEMNKCESNCTRDIRPFQDFMKQESSYVHSVAMQSTKRKKEDFWVCKDRSGKKRAKSVDRETDGRRSPHASESDRDLQIFKADSRSLKNDSLKEIGAQNYDADHSLATEPNTLEANHNVITVGKSSEASYPDMFGVCSVRGVVKQDQTSLKGQPLVEKEDGQEMDVAGENAIATRVESSLLDLHTVPEFHHNHVLQLCNGDNSFSSVQPFVKLKGESKDDDKEKPLISQSYALKDERICSDPGLVQFKISGAAFSMSHSSDNQAQHGKIRPELQSDLGTDGADGLSGDVSHVKQETKGSTDGEKGQGETICGVRSLSEQSKPGAIVLSSQASLKMDSKLPSDDIRCEEAQIPDPNVKPRSISESKFPVIKDSHPLPPSEQVRDEETHNLQRKILKEHEKNLSNSACKVSYSGRSSQDSSKQVDPDSKNYVLNSSLKASSSCGEANENFCHVKALPGQNKTLASGLVQRGEKLNHSNVQPVSKANQINAASLVSSTVPITPAMLSDEELALLLHQELNSSPRVPRVPRVRHASSLPQLASPSGSGLLMKRTSNSGGKDHILVSRRKHKDASKDEVCKPHEAEEDCRKLEKSLSSPEQRKHDGACIEDSSVKEEDLGSSTAHSVSKNLSFVSTSTANSGPSSPPEDPSLSSTRDSPRITMDDDSVGRRVHRTLPGLINEIMSKGRRMTYEELCNAVLPHWQNLRKHNGERYAYSSHSQAVLDCLRNRHEWARLVDRGPKTNLNRKRRKLEAEESDGDEWSKSRWAKEVEGMNLELQKEEFPKGKRKARKRRRLALQGRAVKDVRKRQKAYSSDEDAGPLSNCSEDSLFSDDETQGGGAYPVGSNASVSSDEAGTSN